MVVVRTSGCIKAIEVVLGFSSGKMVAFGQKWLNSGKRCCIRPKVVVFGQGSCYRAKWLYTGKSGCIQSKVVVLGKVVVFGQGWM